MVVLLAGGDDPHPHVPIERANDFLEIFTAPADVFGGGFALHVFAIQSLFVEVDDLSGTGTTCRSMTGAAATSALIFPYTAPAALVWGFKKGDDAVVRGSKQFAAVIKNDMEIAGLVPEKDRVIYHYAESLKAKQNNAATPTQFPRLPVRN